MIGREHDEGPVGNDPVEMLPRYALLVGEDRVVGLLADQQSLAQARRRVSAHRLLQCLEPMHTMKLQIVDLGRAGKKMHMRFDEARQDGPPCASMMRVEAFLCDNADCVSPMNRILLPAIATASACGRASSIVMTRPLVMMMSALMPLCFPLSQATSI